MINKFSDNFAIATTAEIMSFLEKFLKSIKLLELGFGALISYPLAKLRILLRVPILKNSFRRLGTSLVSICCDVLESTAKANTELNVPKVSIATRTGKINFVF